MNKKKVFLTVLILSLVPYSDGVTYLMPPISPNSIDYISFSSSESIKLSSKPTTGTLNVVVLCVNFTDTPFTKNIPGDIQTLFGNEKGAVAHYFQEVSYGSLLLNSTVYGPFASDYNISFYGRDKGKAIDSFYGHPNRLVNETVHLANQSGVPFEHFDNNGNGVIDILVIVHSGEAQESQSTNTDLIWSHYSSVAIKITENLEVKDYIMVSATSPLGVVVHELGHAIGGLPDLYDTDYSSDGIGRWCVMAGGAWNGDPSGSSPAHYSAWCKIKMGWITPTVVSDPRIDEVVAQIETFPVAYKLPISTSKDGKEEYFLIVNRQKIGYDEDIPASGLLIWHIDETMSDNTNENRRLVDLKKAGGDVPINDPSVPFRDTKSGLTDNTYPNSNDNNGRRTGWRITNINGSGTYMKMTVSKLTENDVAVEYITREEIVNISDPIEILVFISNKGINDQLDFTIHVCVYYQDYTKSSIVGRKIEHVDILPYSGNITFSYSIIPSQKGKYIIDAYADLIDDIPENNRKIVHTKVTDLYFNDSVESGNIGWTEVYKESGGYRWRIVNNTSAYFDAYKGSYSWYFGHEENSTLNVSGDYYGTLISPLIDLRNVETAYFTFFSKYELRMAHSIGDLEYFESIEMTLMISIDNTTWNELDTFSGTQLRWRRFYVDISNYTGYNITLMFNITAHHLLPLGGWWMDSFFVISDPFDYGVILLAIQNETLVDPGKNSSMKIMVVNVGDFDDTFSLSIGELPEGISVSLSSEIVSLGFDESEIVTVTVSASGSAKRGDTLYFNITATSMSDHSIKSTATLSVSITREPWSPYVWIYLTMILIFVGLIISHIHSESEDY